MLIAVAVVTATPLNAAEAPTVDKLLSAAKSTGQPLLLEFGADWCLPCRDLAAALSNVAAVRSFALEKIDVAHSDGEAVASRFKVRKIPTLIAIASDGQEVGRLVGVTRAPTLTAELDVLARIAKAKPGSNNAIELFAAALRAESGGRLEEARRLYSLAEQGDSSNTLGIGAKTKLRLIVLQLEGLTPANRAAAWAGLLERYPRSLEAVTALFSIAVLVDRAPASARAVLPVLTEAVQQRGDGDAVEPLTYALIMLDEAKLARAFADKACSKHDADCDALRAEAAFQSGERNVAIALEKQTLAALERTAKDLSPDIRGQITGPATADLKRFESNERLLPERKRRAVEALALTR